MAEKRRPGRPSMVDEWLTEEGLETIAHMAAFGWREQDMAERIGVAVDTWYQWKQRYPQFAETIKKNKHKAVEKVEEALYKTAVGYDVTDGEGTVRHIPGDKTAQIFFLKNRARWRWLDKPNSELDDEEQKARIAKLQKEAAEDNDKNQEIKIVIEGGTDYAD